MSEKRIITRPVSLLVVAAVAVCFAFAANAMNQRTSGADERVSFDQWEYLVVSGANSNLTPSGNPNMRKESPGSFGREAFVLEQQMDKLGAKGWELVSVSGHPSDPVYYFKRRK
jgi:hypothetical protein